MGVARAPIERVAAAAYTIPTDAPESDGTLQWDATTLVLARVRAAGREGIGYSYTHEAAAALVHDKLAPLLEGRDAHETAARYDDMVRAVRNLGLAGLCATAISAVDCALWDLKGKLLDASLVDLLGAARDEVRAYGSGGFTSYAVDRLREQLGGWADEGFFAVKMKVGRDPAADPDRVQAARSAIGAATGLFVDANGAYTRKQALAKAHAFAASGVQWFEEPVSSDDLDGLRLLRDRGPAGMAITAGEYGYDPWYFRRMLGAGAVDVIQADATRCGGVSGFLAAAALADGFELPLSSHCAPTLHLPLCCAARRAVHMEWFHDHVRIERMLFDGAPQPVRGVLRAPRDRPGLGIALREEDARRYLRAGSLKGT